MQRPEQAATRVGRNPLQGPVAAVGMFSALLLVGSLAAALADGRPWESIADGPWVEHDTGIEGVVLSLPRALGDGRTRGEERIYGDLASTGYLVTVRIHPLRPAALTSGKLFLEHRRLRKTLLREDLPNGFVRVGEPLEVETTMRFDLTETFSVNSARAVRRTVSVPSGAVVITLVSAADAAPIAERVVAGPPDPT
jgi:hypothetical protein